MSVYTSNRDFTDSLSIQLASQLIDRQARAILTASERVTTLESLYLAVESHEGAWTPFQRQMFAIATRNLEDVTGLSMESEGGEWTPSLESIKDKLHEILEWVTEKIKQLMEAIKAFFKRILLYVGKLLALLLGDRVVQHRTLSDEELIHTANALSIGNHFAPEKIETNLQQMLHSHLEYHTTIVAFIRSLTNVLLKNFVGGSDEYIHSDAGIADLTEGLHGLVYPIPSFMKPVGESIQHEKLLYASLPACFGRRFEASLPEISPYDTDPRHVARVLSNAIHCSVNHDEEATGHDAAAARKSLLHFKEHGLHTARRTAVANLNTIDEIVKRVTRLEVLAASMTTAAADILKGVQAGPGNFKEAVANSPNYGAVVHLFKTPVAVINFVTQMSTWLTREVVEFARVVNAATEMKVEDA